MAIRGYTPEVEEAYNRALALVDQAGGLPDRIPVLRGLAALYLYRGEFDRTLEVGRQLLAVAEQQHDTGVQAEGHVRIGTSLVSLGQADAGLEHLERAAEMFDPAIHGTGRFRLGTSPGVTPHTTSAFVRWLRGEADRAWDHAARAIEVADHVGQPYTLAYARFHVGLLNVWERRWETAHALATQVLELARTNEYHVWEATALVMDGLARTALGEPDEGLPASDRGITLYQEMSAPPVFWPLLVGLRARTLALVGRAREGVDALEQIGALMEGPANVLAPQFLVLRGDLLAQLGDTVGAETSYRSAVDLARFSGARMNELQAAVGLVRLADDARRDAALELLRETYDGFTEGSDAPDVVEAAALLRD
jgi:tetratricopeptide (TPR) repeat protein